MFDEKEMKEKIVKSFKKNFIKKIECVISYKRYKIELKNNEIIMMPKLSIKTLERLMKRISDDYILKQNNRMYNEIFGICFSSVEFDIDEIKKEKFYISTMKKYQLLDFLFEKVIIIETAFQTLKNAGVNEDNIVLIIDNNFYYDENQYKKKLDAGRYYKKEIGLYKDIRLDFYNILKEDLKKILKGYIDAGHTYMLKIKNNMEE